MNGNPYWGHPTQSVNGFVGCAPAASMSDKINEYALKKNIDLDAKARELWIKREAEIDLAEQKELLKLDRDFARDGVYMDAEGHLMYEIVFRKKRSSTQLLNVQYLRAERLISSAGIWVEVSWFTAEQQKTVIIDWGDFSARSLEKALLSAGVKINVSSRKRRDASCALLEYLSRVMSEREIPENYGWSKMRNGWVYTEEGERCAIQLRNR